MRMGTKAATHANIRTYIMRHSLYKVWNHFCVLSFWSMVGFSIYGFHHFILKLNGYSKLDAMWEMTKIYMKWA